jgi:hypothetical protein
MRLYICVRRSISTTGGEIFFALPNSKNKIVGFLNLRFAKRIPADIGVNPILTGINLVLSG